MVKFMRIAIAVFSIFAAAATACAQSPVAYRIGPGMQTRPQASEPSHSPTSVVIYSDSGASNALKFDDLTTVNTIAACVPTTNGDVCAWNGTKFVRAAAGGGGAGTFATVYSSTAANNIVALGAAGGGLEFDDASTPITAPFISGYTHSGNSGNSYFTLGNDGLTLAGRGRASGAPPEVLYIQNAGASAIAASTPAPTITIDFGTTQTWTGGGSWTNPQRWVDVDSNPTMNFASSTTVPFQSTWHIAAPLCGTNGTCTRMPALELTEGGLFVSDASSGTKKLIEIMNNARNSTYFSVDVNATKIGTASIIPTSDGATDAGSTAVRFGNVQAYRYTIAVGGQGFTATPTFDFSTSYNWKQITLTGNITSWTMSGCSSTTDGMRAQLQFVQDGTGSRTLATPPSNVRAAGNSMTLSTGAGKSDVFTFRCVNGDGKWYEESRSLNQ